MFQKSPLTFPAQSLEKEVQKVKATLQTMLAQLKEEDEDEVNALTDDVLMKNVTDDDEEDEEDEEEEDQYFSDSWDIWNRSLWCFMTTHSQTVALWDPDPGFAVVVTLYPFTREHHSKSFTVRKHKGLEALCGPFYQDMEKRFFLNAIRHFKSDLKTFFNSF